MSDSPPPTLTDRNGVMCQACWKSIDLTDKNAIVEFPHFWKRKTWEDRLHFHPVGYFHAKCQNCGKVSCHAPEEVSPLEPSWAEQKQVFEDRIRILKAQLAEARADNKVLAGAVHDDLPEADEPDLPSTIPREPTRKAPTPPKGPDLEKEKGPYT